MDELEISGRRYLSTRRAAKDHKYTSDYVGQLIRGGKVVGKKVGRSWYVDEQSLNAYLSGDTASATPVVKAVVEEKPVEPVVKETPASSPVVEVTKPEVVEAPKKSNIEYVEEKTFEPVVIKTQNLEEHHIPIHTTAPVTEKPSAGLRYIVDDEPALPEITKKQAVATTPAVVTHKVVEEDVVVEDEYVERVPQKKVGAFAISGLVVAGLATLFVTAVFSATLNSRIVVEEGQVASVGYTFQ